MMDANAFLKRMLLVVGISALSMVNVAHAHGGKGTGGSSGGGSTSSGASSGSGHSASSTSGALHEQYKQRSHRNRLKGQSFRY